MKHTQETKEHLRAKWAEKTPEERSAIAKKGVAHRKPHEPYHWYTNGEKNVLCAECPDGFIAGRTLNDHQKRMLRVGAEKRKLMKQSKKGIHMGEVPWNAGKRIPRTPLIDTETLKVYLSIAHLCEETGVSYAAYRKGLKNGKYKRYYNYK